jgi:hypothetical protein
MEKARLTYDEVKQHGMAIVRKTLDDIEHSNDHNWNKQLLLMALSCVQYLVDLENIMLSDVSQTEE